MDIEDIDVSIIEELEAEDYGLVELAWHAGEEPPANPRIREL